MNSRERVLLGVLLGVLIVGAACGGGYFFILDPYLTLSAELDGELSQLDVKEKELQKEEALTKEILARNPLLSDWKKTSLPAPHSKTGAKAKSIDEMKPHLADLQVKYHEYLTHLCHQSGFTANTIDIQAKTVDSRSGLGTASNKKDPIYIRLPFSVKAQGNLAALQKMLEAFYKEPVLQEVKSITVQPLRQTRGRFVPIDEGATDPLAAPDQPIGPGRGNFPGGNPLLNPFNRGAGIPLAGGAEGAAPGGVGAFPPGGGRGGRGGAGSVPTYFEVTMTVEALMLTGAETRPTLLPDLSGGKITLLPDRHFADILVKNPFGNPPGGTRGLGDGSSESAQEALGFVKLTMIYHNGRRWEATFYNQALGPPERRVNTFTLDEFTVFDRFDNIAFDGKVKLIDEKQLVLESSGKFYRMYVGDFLYQALRHPLSDGELKELGLKKTVAATAPSKTDAKKTD